MKIRRHNRETVRPKQKILMPVKTNRYLRRQASMQPLPLRRLSVRRPSLLSLSTLSLSLLTVLTVLILATLNCAILIVRSRTVPVQNYSVMVNRLPTLTPTTNVASIAMAGQVTAATAAITPTPMPTIIAAGVTPAQNRAAVASPAVQSIAQVPPTPTFTPWPTPTSIPTSVPLVEPAPATVAPTPTPALMENSEKWSFAALRTDEIPARNMLMLYGEMINDSGTTQQVFSVAGTFYDSQGQIIPVDQSSNGVWPTDVIPPGGRVPFLLTVQNARNVSNFDLSVQSEPVEIVPRQDFEFVDVNEQVNGIHRCLSGALKNPGGQLADYLVIAGIFYDDQGNILRFANDNKSAFNQLTGDGALNFKICIKSPPNSNVASHKLLAWGS